jgi:tryptophan-rich sensory protein
MLVGSKFTVLDSWYYDLPKPSWNPPNWVFPTAWTIVGIFTIGAGVSAWNHSTDAGSETFILFLFAINAALHMLWSFLFFRMHRPDWALVETAFLWLSVMALIIELAPFSTLASWLLLPYLLWVSVAGTLTYSIVRMNPPFGSFLETGKYVKIV